MLFAGYVQIGLLKRVLNLNQLNLDFLSILFTIYLMDSYFNGISYLQSSVPTRPFLVKAQFEIFLIKGF